jgi:hypothetical protein
VAFRQLQSAKKTEVLGFKGVEHLRAKTETNNQILEQINCFNYLGCNISYVRSEDPEIKLTKFLQLIGTIKRTLLKRVRKETVLKFYKTLAVPLLLYGAENLRFMIFKILLPDAKELVHGRGIRTTVSCGFYVKHRVT